MGIPAIPNILKLKRMTGSARRLQDNLLIVLFLLPALILFVFFVIYPIFRSIYFSTFNWNGLGPAVKFIGIHNYQQILVDKVFIKAITNVLVLVILSVGVQLPLALGLAVLVGRDLPGRGLFRTFFFLPYVLSEVNVAIMFLLLYNPNPERGLLNAVVVLFGAKPVGWLSNPDIALYSIFVALTWKFFGFHMLLYLAGLQNIPAELEEAARIDGANAFQNFWYITLPLLGNTIRTSAYLSVLGCLQTFVLVQVMTRGGPVNATEVLATYMYRFGFIRYQIGYASAVTLYMFLFCLTFSLIYQYLTRKPDYLTGL